MTKRENADAVSFADAVMELSGRFIVAVVSGIAVSVVSFVGLKDWAFAELQQSTAQFIVWSVAAFIVGASVATFFASAVHKKKARQDIKAKDAEIARLKDAVGAKGAVGSDDTAREPSTDELESRFIAMPFKSKMLCAGIWQNGGIERDGGRTPDDARRAARESGFVTEEETSEFGRVRFSASPYLTRLFSERPEVYNQVLSDFARGTYRVEGGKLRRVK